MPRHDMENIQVIRKAVKLYESNRCLWDPKQKHYFNKISRQMIWRRISAEVNIPVPEVKKKLTSLLGSYRREKSRENKSKLKNRSGTGKVYKSKWFAYPWFTFLSNKNIPNNTEDSLCDEAQDTTETNADEINEDSSNTECLDNTTDTNLEEDNKISSFGESIVKVERLNTSNLHDIEPVSSGSQNVMVAPWAKNKVRRRRLNATVTSKCSSSSNVDHFTSFGNHIANELRKYDEHVVPHIKKAILDIVFQADTGQFPVQHGYSYTSGYHTSSPSTDPIGSPPHVQREESSDSVPLQQNMDSDIEDQKESLLE